MKKWIGNSILCIFSIVIFCHSLSITGYASTKNLTKYELCVNGYSLTLTKNTGYIAKNKDTVMVPIGCILTMLNEAYVLNDKMVLTTTLKNGTKIRIKPGKNNIKVNDAYITMSKKNQTKNGVLMVSAEILDYFDVNSHLYEPSKETIDKGYKNGVFMIEKIMNQSEENEVIKKETVLPVKKETSIAASLQASLTTNQIVTVQQKKGANALVCFHEKESDGTWKKVYETKGYIGKNGLGKQVQGDRKTPVGEYNLTTPFGRKKNPGTSMKYTKLTKYHYWSSDESKWYSNQLVDVRELGVSYVPGEHLTAYGKCYNYGLFVDYNKSGEKRKGSCIFLHCFSGKKSTEGCIAISEKMMKKFLIKMKDGAKIYIYSSKSK